MSLSRKKPSRSWCCQWCSLPPWQEKILRSILQLHYISSKSDLCLSLKFHPFIWKNMGFIIFAFENKNFRNTIFILSLGGDGHIRASVYCHTDTYTLISVYRCRQNFLSWKNWRITNLVGSLSRIIHLLMELRIILVLATAAAKLLTLMRMLKGKV